MKEIKSYLFLVISKENLGVEDIDVPDYIVKVRKYSNYSMALNAGCEAMGAYCKIYNEGSCNKEEELKKLKEQIKNHQFNPENEEGWF